MTSTNNDEKETRRIRVFISSTFRDMKLEREELVKFVFPELRRICEQRDVEWGEIDLRWGVSDEQKAEKGILPICLDEIDRCRPYFIGVLGERYGWIPDTIPQSLIDKQPWLEKHLKSSITALEILHGVILQPKMADHAYFYFRDPSYISSLEVDEQANFLELPTKEEIESLSPKEAEKQAEIRRQKLLEVKETLKNMQFPVKTYNNPKEFGRLVLKDFIKLIDKLYPEGSYPNPYDRELAEQNAYISAKFWAKNDVYIKRSSYFDQLNSHVIGNSPPLVITGNPGSGKSALLANWIINYNASKEPFKPLLISHFIGATVASTQWRLMLKRIINEIDRNFDFHTNYADTAQGIRKAFEDIFSRLKKSDRIILVIDGLDHLEDNAGALDLVWLPSQITPNLRLILSTNSGKPLEAAKARGWPILSIDAFNVSEQENFIQKYFLLYGKTLSQNRIDRIVHSPITSNPLFLSEFLNEIRIYGEYETLDDKIDSLLNAHTIEDLYIRIIERLENDYSKDRLNLVRDAMTLIAASRKGLSERELLDLLGEEKNPLPGHYWSPLYLALENILISKSGLLNFVNDYFRHAIYKNYFDSGVINKENIHRDLAEYFESKDYGKRKLDELPWQLQKARLWKKLSELLKNQKFLELLWIYNNADLLGYWTVLENQGSIKFSDMYKSIRDAPEEYPVNFVRIIAQGYAARGNIEEAITLQRFMVSYYRTRKDYKNLIPAIGNLAETYFSAGDLEKAHVLLKEEELLSREFDHFDYLQNSLGNQGDILFQKNDLEGALFLYRQQEIYCRNMGNLEGLHRSLGNQASVLFKLGDMQGALKLQKEVAQIARKIGDKATLKSSLFNQIIVFFNRDDNVGAANCIKHIKEIDNNF